MATRQESSIDAGNGPRPARWLKAWPGRLAVLAVACLALANVAARKDRIGRNGQKEAAPAASAAAVPGMPTTLTKNVAIDAVVGALSMNSTPAAEKTLEQMVTGEIPFGGHSRQAAQKAMVNLAMRAAMKPSPEIDAFLARIFSDPDEAIRTSDQNVYPAADLRNDTAQVLAKIGSPGVRLALAKIYNQSSTPPETRAVLEKVLRARVPANFAAQAEVVRGAETPELLKSALQKTLLKQNEAAMRAALKLADEEKAKPGAAGATPFTPIAKPSKSAAPSGGGLLAAVGQLFGGGSSAPSAGANPFAAMASITPAEIKTIVANVQKRMEAAAAKAHKPFSPTQMSPEVIQVEMVAYIQSKQPIDLGVVAKELWNSEFVESIAKDISDSKDLLPIVNTLASLPIKASREKLKEILHKQRTKGPEDFAKMEKVAAAETPAGSGGAGNRRGKNKKDDAAPAAPTRRGGMQFGWGMQNKKSDRQEVAEFGTDWYDPGSLVVLKSVVPYAERPPEKPTHHSMYPQQQRRISPAMEKRMAEKEAKQKAKEATYDWRDAIQKAVRQWDERFAAVAEEPSGAGDKPAADEDKGDSKGDSAPKPGKRSAASSLSKSSAPKTPAAAPPPTPSVPMPFALHAGEAIAKEYHQRWPQDLTANFGSSAPKAEPMSVDYVRLEGKGQMSKTLTHYKNAIDGLHAVKPKVTLRKIENGTWLDALLKDESTHRTRSIDVIMTKEESDDADKKSGEAQVTVEILLVEIETPGGDAAPSHGKKENNETTSTTSP